MNICKVVGCEKPAVSRGWCNTHYQRWYRHRDPEALRHGPTGGTVLERLSFWIDASGDCWEWTGYCEAGGYGITTIDRTHYVAHRAVWENLVGSIPENLTLDHLCRNRSCVNPDHLEPVTQRENWLRGENPFIKNARKTHCKNGHLFNKVNTHHYVRDGSNRRRCRKCTAIRTAKTRSKSLPLGKT